MKMYSKVSRVELCLLFFLVFSVETSTTFRKNHDTEFTFLLAAGGTECFFQPTAMNGSMEVEYQVIEGFQLEVGFTLISPHGYRIVSDFRKLDGIHLVEPTEEGDYRLCFDNSFGQLGEKMVFVGIMVASGASAAENEVWATLLEPENPMDYKLDDIRVVVDAVHWNLERCRQTQAVLRASEARDRHLLEGNLKRVAFWSGANLLLILGVALAQVYAVRRLFHGDIFYL